MAHVIDSRGVDLGDITNPDLLTYYRREPGYTVGGVTTPANPARSNADILPVWAANTIYAAGQEILDPTGVTIIVRQSTGTSRSTYDTTEQALWSAAGSTAGGSLTVQDENANVSTSVTQIDFQGAGVTASAGTGEVVVTIPGGSTALTPTAVKTANYTAAAGDLVPVDTTSGNVTVTLPTAPADKTQVGVKHVVRGGTNTVSLACGGSDVFNKTGGSTTATLTLLNQGAVLQYKAAGAIWYVVSDDLALSQLDLRYDALGAAAAVLPTQTGHASQFLKTDGAGTLSWSANNPTGWFDIRDYGAVVNGRSVYDAVTTNASPTVTSATAAFVAGDVGKKVQVETSAGVVITGIVSAVNSATSITVSTNASGSVTSGTLIVGTDDTAAVQLATNAAIAANGGTVFFPPGICVLAGAQQTGTVSAASYTYSGQIVLPARGPLTGQLMVRFTGPTPTPQAFWSNVGGNDMPPEVAGVAIVRTFATSGNIIDCIPSTSQFAISYFTNVAVDIENILFRTPNNPSCGGLKLVKALSARLRCFTVGVDATSFNVAPGTHSTVAVWLPGFQNAASSDVIDGNIYGFGTGLIHSEHTTAQSVNIQKCNIGISPDQGILMSFYERVTIQFCTTGIKPLNSCKVSGHVVFEHGGTGGGIDIDDYPGYLEGTLGYYLYPSTYTVSNGCSRLSLYRLDVDGYHNLKPQPLIDDFSSRPTNANAIGQSSLSGQVWLNSFNGPFGINGSGKAYNVNGAADNSTAVARCLNTATPAIKADITLGAARANCGLAARSNGSGTFLAFVFESDNFATNTVYLYKFTTGSRVQLATAALSLTLGTTHTFEVDMTATTVTCKVDASTVLTYTLTSPEQTTFGPANFYAGLFAQSGGTTDSGSTFANFSAV